MKLAYLFRDRNFNKSQVSVHWVDTKTPADFAIVQSVGVLVSSLSDAQLIEATITYPGDPLDNTPGQNSDVSRLYLCCCFLETGDAHLIVIPSADIQYLGIDEDGQYLPVIPLDSPVMTDIQGLCDTGVDEYGTKLAIVHIIGLAI